MWEELEVRLRTLDCFKEYLGMANIFLGIGNKKAKYLIIFEDFKDETLLKDNLLEFEEMSIYIKMFKLLKIDIKDIYVTSIYKLEKRKTNIGNANIRELLDILYIQINLINPEYILVIGEEAFNFLVSTALNLNFREKNVKIENCIGNRYNFFSKILIPIYNYDEMKKASAEEKHKIINSIIEGRN